MSGLDRDLRIRCSAAQLERWNAAAEAAGVSLSRYARQAIDERVDLEEAIRRNEAAEAERSRRLHEGDPSAARARDWDRLGPPYRGGSRS